MTPTAGGEPSAPRCRARHMLGAIVGCWLTLAAAATPSLGQVRAESLPGASLDSVMPLARQLSPVVAARALEMAAAQARVTIAGALPDPTMRILSDEIDRISGPRQNKMIYSVEQDLPLWGKRELRRQAANAEVDQAAAEGRSTEAQLVEKIKIAFAQYYIADRAVAVAADLQAATKVVASAAQARYAQGQGAQIDVLKAESEVLRVAVSTLRQTAVLTAARGQLNTLLIRPADAALARPKTLRALPPEAALNPRTLAARLQQRNPALEADAAGVRIAEASRGLAERAGYPDLTLGAAAIDRGSNGPAGFMVWVGAKVPLQWGAVTARRQEAEATAGAMRARQDARAQLLLGELAEALAVLDGNRKLAAMIDTRLVAQIRAVRGAAMTAYSTNRGELVAVLQAERELFDLRMQSLQAVLEAQRQIALIERLVGGAL